MGNIKKAKEYDELIKTKYGEISELSTSISSYEKDYKQAFEQLKSLYNDQNQVVNAILTQNVSVALEEMYKTQESKLNHDLRNTKMTLSIIVIISLFVFALILFYLYIERLKFRQKEREQIETVESLQENITNLLHNLDEREKSSLVSVQYINKILSSFNDICQSYIEASDSQPNNPKAHIRVYNSLLDKIKSYQDDKTFFNNLKCTVNSLSNEIIEKFEKDFPNISDEELKIFLFRALGFTPGVISLFINTDLKGVYNKKHRLKKKIAESDSTYKDAYLTLLK